MNNNTNNTTNNEDMPTSTLKRSHLSQPDLNQQQLVLDPSNTMITTSSNVALASSAGNAPAGVPSTSSSSASYYTINETATDSSTAVPQQQQTSTPNTVVESKSNASGSDLDPHSYINDFGILASDTNWSGFVNKHTRACSYLLISLCMMT